VSKHLAEIKKSGEVHLPYLNTGKLDRSPLGLLKYQELIVWSWISKNLHRSLSCSARAGRFLSQPETWLVLMPRGPRLIP
jgi:hypothetical protein